jgi:hypothetical protein
MLFGFLSCEPYIPSLIPDADGKKPLVKASVFKDQVTELQKKFDQRGLDLENEIQKMIAEKEAVNVQIKDRNESIEAQIAMREKVVEFVGSGVNAVSAGTFNWATLLTGIVGSGGILGAGMGWDKFRSTKILKKQSIELKILKDKVGGK